MGRVERRDGCARVVEGARTLVGRARHARSRLARFPAPGSRARSSRRPSARRRSRRRTAPRRRRSPASAMTPRALAMGHVERRDGRVVRCGSGHDRRRGRAPCAATACTPPAPAPAFGGRPHNAPDRRRSMARTVLAGRSNRCATCRAAHSCSRTNPPVAAGAPGSSASKVRGATGGVDLFRRSGEPV
jgi:hypothetical protein